MSAEIKTLFLVIIACLGIILVSVSAQGGSMAFDGKGNLFVAGPDCASILKFTSDGKRSTFASGLNDANDMAFDDKGKLFVRDGNTIFKFTPERIDANTAILYSYSQWFVGDDQGDLDANFLFTLKFDAEGNWKIVKTHRMSEKEVERKEKGE